MNTTPDNALIAMWDELDAANRYATILIDPPWPIQKMIPEGASADLRPSRRSTNLDYPTMSLPEIHALPMSDLMADDCHVYLWVTQKYIEEGYKILRAWGLKPHCLLTWVKMSGIVPFSFCFNTEHIIFAYRGEFRMKNKGQKLSFEARATEHSVKPECSYDLIERASYEPYLEMFARRKRPGWHSWGNQVQSDLQI